MGEDNLNSNRQPSDRDGSQGKNQDNAEGNDKELNVKVIGKSDIQASSEQEDPDEDDEM